MASKTQTIGRDDTPELLRSFFNIAVVLFLTVGSVAMVFGLTSRSGMALLQDSYLPTFSLGLIAIAVLFNVYLVGHKWAGRQSANRKPRSLPLVDPLTQLLSNSLNMNQQSENTRLSS